MPAYLVIVPSDQPQRLDAILGNPSFQALQVCSNVAAVSVLGQVGADATTSAIQAALKGDDYALVQIGEATMGHGALAKVIGSAVFRSAYSPDTSRN